MVLVVLAASAGRADAITLTEIMELSRAGLSDDILLALIEVDQRVFAIDPATLKTLKDAGVSAPVIVAIVKSGRTPQPQPEPQPLVDLRAPDPPDPQVVFVDRPVVREVQVAVPVPVYVAVGSRSRSRHRDASYVVPPSPFVPFGNAVDARPPEPSEACRTRLLGLGRQAQAGCLAARSHAAQALEHFASSRLSLLLALSARARLLLREQRPSAIVRPPDVL